MSRQQRRAARARINQARDRARATVAALPEMKRARRRRWRRRALIAALLLLLLLLHRCECGPAPRIEPELAAVVTLDAGVKRVPKRPALKATKEGLAAKPRASWETGAQLGPAWLDEFRMQVSARSPRLAHCFTGSERPGALRWSVALNPETGAVSDQDLEPLGAAEPNAKQRECLQKALADPKYHIAAADRLSVPSRVTLMIEF